MFEVFCLYLVRKNIFMRVLIFLISFLLFGCSDNTSNVNSNQKQREEFQYNLRVLSISYSPAFSNSVDILIDFDDKYICVYPPHDFYNPNIDVVDPFMIYVKDDDLKKVDDFVKTFDSIDFKKTSEGYAKDGLHLEALFVFSNQTLQKVSPGNMPIKKYEDLSKLLLEIVLKYNKSKGNEKVIKEIQEYY